VIRRCPAPLTAMVAALVFGLGLQPICTHADQVGTADYTLTSAAGLPVPTGAIPTTGSSNIPAPQVEALVQPSGGVVTPATTSTQGPLTILAGSHGFDTSGVWDFLANTTQNGQAFEGLGLSFYGQGLAAGGVLNFSLNVANASNPPQLVSGTKGVTITLDPPSSSSSGSSTSTVGVDGVVPEPLSLLLWSALAGAGLLRAHALRRSSRVAADC
jgi:hypothetical protein